MRSEFSTERSDAEAMGKDTAEGLIDKVEESLTNGFFDKEEREESKRMLRTAQLLTRNPEVKKRIDRLFADIENLYGSV